MSRNWSSGSICLQHELQKNSTKRSKRVFKATSNHSLNCVIHLQGSSPIDPRGKSKPLLQRACPGSQKGLLTKSRHLRPFESKLKPGPACWLEAPYLAGAIECSTATFGSALKIRDSTEAAIMPLFWRAE